MFFSGFAGLRHYSSVIAFSAISLSGLVLNDQAVAKEVCIKYSGSVLCGELVAKPQNSRTQSQPAVVQGAAVEKDKMRFQSGGCNRVAKDEITCGAVVTNLGEETVTRYFTSDTRAIELSGNAVKAVRVYQGVDQGDTSSITTSLDPGVPTMVKFLFKGVSKDATSLSALSVNYALPGSSRTTVSIRTIAIK
jgi:hypothetical protein